MNEKFREAFDQVRAEEELKRKTKMSVLQRVKKRRGEMYRKYLWAAAAACMLLFVAGGFRIYFTPVAEISIDINPSLELGVNRFERIISVNGFNEDGQVLADSLDITNLVYSEGIDRILESEQISRLLEEDEIMTIGVIEREETYAGELLAGVEACTGGAENISCYTADIEEVENAHEMGLSYGKYRAFLQVQKQKPDITAEEIRDMTMREIRDLLESTVGASSQEAGLEQSGEQSEGSKIQQRKGQDNGRQKK